MNKIIHTSWICENDNYNKPKMLLDGYIFMNIISKFDKIREICTYVILDSTKPYCKLINMK